MKKSIITALMILMIITCSVIPFSVKAASNMVYGTGGTFTEGEYNVWTIQADSNSHLQFYAFDKFYNFNEYRTAVVTKIDLDDKYTGNITLNLSVNYTTMPLFWVEVESGSCGIDGYSKSFILNLNDCQSLTVYWCSTQSSTNNIQPISVVTNNMIKTSEYNDIINAINTLADYNIPQRSLPAYIFASSISNPVVMNPGNYAPYVKVDANGTSRQGKYIKWDANDREATYHFVVIANVVLSSSNVSSQNGNIDLTFNTGIYDFGNYSVTDVEINGKSGTLLNPVSDRLVYGRTIYLYPLFYGRGYDMPDDVRQMLGWDTKQNQMLENSYELNAWVTEIYNIIAQDNSGTSDDIDDTTDAVIDLTDQEHDITDDFAGSLTDFNTNMNLNDFNFTSLFMDANNYFKNQLDTLYTESGGFQAFWVIPIILIIIRVLLGGTV